MKILIIGSKGFIGSHLVIHFEKEHQVWKADIVESNEEKYFQISITNSKFDFLFKLNKYDVCINASGNGSVPISFNNPSIDFDLNVCNTFKLIETIRTLNPECKFVNLSSAAVYGNPQSLPISECAALSPLSPYGYHKLHAEQICQEYFDLYRISTVSLRIFSVYGAGLKKQLLWDIYNKSLESNKVVLFGTGDETRDFIYISDLIRAIDVVIDNANFDGKAINVASGNEVSIREIAMLFAEKLNKSIIISFNNVVKEGDPLKWRADIQHLKKWEYGTRTTLDNGLNNLVAWLKEKK